MIKNALAITALISIAAFAQTGGRHPYAAGRPLPEPALFGEGVLSTPEFDLNAAFLPDGKTVYFTRSTANMGFWTIVVSHFRNGKWTTPEVAPFSGQYSDADLCISPDGSKMFFISRRPVDGGARPVPHIWYVERSGAGWSAPANISILNGPSGEYYPSVAADGTLYFATVRPEGKGRNDLYRSRFVNGAYTTPENLGEPVNSPFNEGDSAVAPDQSFIVMTITGRKDDLGSGDLYITEQKDGRWTEPRHLGPKVNSSSVEFCPSLSPDGKYLFFTSTRGFEPPARPLQYGELMQKLRGALNGLGNVYQIDLGAIR